MRCCRKLSWPLSAANEFRDSPNTQEVLTWAAIKELNSFDLCQQFAQARSAGRQPISKTWITKTFNGSETFQPTEIEKSKTAMKNTLTYELIENSCRTKGKDAKHIKRGSG